MLFAFGSDDEAEFVTAWHTPPDTPSHDPSPREPRASSDTDGSTALAADVTFPVHAASPSQVSAPPAAEAADGPATSREPGTCPPLPSPVAAPGPVDAVETDCAWQEPPAQDAVPVDVRGLPSAIAPSHAAELVCTVPEHVASAQVTLALDDDVDEGPVVG